MTLRHLPSRPGCFLIALVALLGASCGEGGTVSPTTPANEAPATRTIQHAMGETEVSGEPQRVVVLDTGELDSAIALGVIPVGGVTALPELPVLEYLKDEAQGMEIVGTIEEPNLEAVAALQPDLILSSKLRHEKIYDELSQIAPTVFTETVGVVWKENFLAHAEALGKLDEAEAMLAAYEKRAAELGERITETFGGQKPAISIVRFLPGETRIYLSETFIGTILQDVALPRPKPQRKKDFALYPSEEQIGLMDGDLLFYTHYGPEGKTTLPDVSGNPLWHGLDAVEEGRAYEVPEDHWMLGIGIRAAGLVLDDLERLVL
jgi:iron complex transport system substrate-binding protein